MALIPRKTTIARSTLVLAAIVFATILLEILMRLFLPKPENLSKLEPSRIFIHENKPNEIYNTKTDLFGEFKVQMNSAGFRDNEFNPGKDPDKIRIAILGDSFEEALQVPFDYRWSRIVQEYLLNSGIKAEVYNFGISGYGTDQEWLVLKYKVLGYKPDIVILAFSPNDIGDVYKNRLLLNENGSLVINPPEKRISANWLGRNVRKLYLYQYIAPSLAKNKATSKYFQKFRIEILGINPKDDRFTLSDAQLLEGPFEIVASRENPPPEVSQSWEIIKLILKDMQKVTIENGAKFAITINIPGTQALPTRRQEMVSQYHLPSSSKANQINLDLLKICEELSLTCHDPFINAQEYLKQKGTLYLTPDGHYNQNGHEFMARDTIDFLLDQKLLESTPQAW